MRTAGQGLSGVEALAGFCSLQAVPAEASTPTIRHRNALVLTARESCLLQVASDLSNRKYFAFQGGGHLSLSSIFSEFVKTT